MADGDYSASGNSPLVQEVMCALISVKATNPDGASAEVQARTAIYEVACFLRAPYGDAADLVFDQLDKHPHADT